MYDLWECAREQEKGFRKQKKNPERVCQKGRPFDTRRKRKEYE